MVNAPTAERAPSPQAEPALEVDALSKAYRIDGGLPFGLRRAVRALNGVSLALGQGETLAVVGESGCGKTTLARCVVGLLEPSDGKIALLGRPLRTRRSRIDRRQLQIVFQNPDDTLNPRQTVGYAIGRPVELFAGLRGKARGARVHELLRAVRLSPDYADRYPEQLSGGERQRVGIARAFAAGARVVVCDEPTSALDMSVQAAVLNLLETLQRENTEAYLFISHDLGVVRHLAHHVMILYLGEVMEIGSAEQVFQLPYHPYTEALLSAVPIPDPAVRSERIRLIGAVPDPSRPPTGCPFQTRCPRKLGTICEEQAAPLRAIAPGHQIRCHIPVVDLQRMQHQPFKGSPGPDSSSEFVTEE
jgi:peptide/nickel transport system ATP-binding protein